MTRGWHTCRMSSRVTLISRPGCHLCATAHDVVATVTGQVGTGFDEWDITADPQLHERYWDKIPVVLVDGEELARYRVDPQVLRAALDAPVSPQ